MAEDQGKKEDQFGFTPEGETLGYISLDEARVLAMEHARDHRSFYGWRYVWRKLVWAVVSQEESEDYYDIRLSYRPAAGFRGEPGIEQFTIDKIGEVRLRQRLQAPSQQGLPVSLLSAVAVAVLTAVAVGAGSAAGGFGSDSEDDGVSSGAALSPPNTSVPPTSAFEPTDAPSPRPSPTAVRVVVPTAVSTPTPVPPENAFANIHSGASPNARAQLYAGPT